MFYLIVHILVMEFIMFFVVCCKKSLHFYITFLKKALQMFGSHIYVIIIIRRDQKSIAEVALPPFNCDL